MTSEAPPPPHRATISELAPQWIIAIATLIVALTGAGFFAGRASAPDYNSAPGPSTNATTTTVMPTVVPDPRAQTTSSDPASEMPDGTQLAAYSFTIVGGYSAPLGDVAPTQSQFTSGPGTNDLFYGSANGLFPEGAANRMLGLKNNAVPTYAGCKSTSLFISGVQLVQGTTFCMSKHGRMIGVTISSGPRDSYAPVGLDVVVWKDSAA